MSPVMRLRAQSKEREFRKTELQRERYDVTVAAAMEQVDIAHLAGR